MDLESLFGRIGDHLRTSLDSANQMLEEVENAYRSDVIAESDFTRIKDFIIDAVTEARAAEPSQVEASQTRLATSARRALEVSGAEVEEIKVGMRLRDRFILDEEIGEGGMSKVYKGRDVLKLEARHRNPFVAIKVLNENFKKRPDGFI